ncbi:hypothetical protein ALC60_10924 [Trachymyrmex zeteki]|uniref:Uncharacterized protein n=1 Tax=Mycetomoellerius zeteki TaxID=64791 RepID=A0A151WQA6_9HYME|nr:hypothetical protein ALC60_10924 [Trachymyrmex zeteki]
MLQTLSGTVQCFVARSAYWITMNPLMMWRKALKVVLRPLPLSTTNREKVSPHYITRSEESSELQEDLLPSYSSSNYAMFPFFFKCVFIILLFTKICISTGMALVSKEQRTQSDTNERYNKKNAFLLITEPKENHTRPLQQSRRDKRNQQTDSMVSFKTAALRAKVNYACMENRTRSNKVLAEGSSREFYLSTFAHLSQAATLSYVTNSLVQTSGNLMSKVSSFNTTLRGARLSWRKERKESKKKSRLVSSRCKCTRYVTHARQ